MPGNPVGSKNSPCPATPAPTPRFYAREPPRTNDLHQDVWKRLPLTCRYVSRHLNFNLALRYPLVNHTSPNNVPTYLRHIASQLQPLCNSAAQTVLTSNVEIIMDATLTFAHRGVRRDLYLDQVLPEAWRWRAGHQACRSGHSRAHVLSRARNNTFGATLSSPAATFRARPHPHDL